MLLVSFLAARKRAPVSVVAVREDTHDALFERSTIARDPSANAQHSARDSSCVSGSSGGITEFSKIGGARFTNEKRRATPRRGRFAKMLMRSARGRRGRYR